MPLHESVIGYQFLYNTLSGDATLLASAPGGVWRGMAPPSTATPFVVMVFQAGIDSVTMNGFRILTDALFQVKVSGEGSKSAAIATAAARIDALISAPTSGTVTQGMVSSCYRQSPLELDELVAGELFLNLGGLYRLHIQQTP